MINRVCGLWKKNSTHLDPWLHGLIVWTVVKGSNLSTSTHDEVWCKHINQGDLRFIVSRLLFYRLSLFLLFLGPFLPPSLFSSDLLLRPYAEYLYWPIVGLNGNVCLGGMEWNLRDAMSRGKWKVGNWVNEFCNLRTWLLCLRRIFQGESRRTSPVSVSFRPVASDSRSIFHALTSPSPLPVKNSPCSQFISRDHTSDRCATIVWTQCCVERSQNLTKVSFPEVSK